MHYVMQLIAEKVTFLSNKRDFKEEKEETNKLKQEQELVLIFPLVK